MWCLKLQSKNYKFLFLLSAFSNEVESPTPHFTRKKYQPNLRWRAHQKEISERQKRMQVVCTQSAAAATLLCIAKVVVEWPIAVAPSSSERLIYRCCPAWQQKNYYDVMPCWCAGFAMQSRPPTATTLRGRESFEVASGVVNL